MSDINLCKSEIMSMPICETEMMLNASFIFYKLDVESPMKKKRNRSPSGDFLSLLKASTLITHFAIFSLIPESLK